MYFCKQTLLHIFDLNSEQCGIVVKDIFKIKQNCLSAFRKWLNKNNFGCKNIKSNILLVQKWVFLGWGWKESLNFLSFLLYLLFHLLPFFFSLFERLLQLLIHWVYCFVCSIKTLMCLIKLLLKGTNLVFAILYLLFQPSFLSVNGL